ncbi:MAG: CBS domain-containing protein [Syntrophobacteraceae bacterium]
MKDLRAETIMVKAVFFTRESTAAKDILHVLLSAQITGMPVTDSEDNVVGVITEFDLLKALQTGKDLWDTAVWELMTKGAITADVSATASEIVNIMTEKNIHRLPITREGKLVGIVARPDILKSQMNP